MSEHCIIQSVLPGDIVFDVGANGGDKADWFLKRGARVVCVEPQPAMIKLLQDRFAGNPLVDVVGKAVGPEIGELPMSICSEIPTLSTLSDTWKQGRFADVKWDAVVNVPVITLDMLVAQFGVPRYLKVDVEGFERQVLSGLTRRVGIISFEFTSEYIRHAFEVMGMLVKLGYTRFNVSVGEDDKFALPEWMPFYDLIPVIVQNVNQRPGLWGDIYAN